MGVRIRIGEPLHHSRTCSKTGIPAVDWKYLYNVLLEKDLVLGPLVSESKYNFRTSVRILGQLSKNRSSIEEPPIFLAGAGDGIRIHDSLLGNYQGDFLELRRSKIPIPKP